MPGKRAKTWARPIVKDFFVFMLVFFLGVDAIKRKTPVIAKPNAVIMREVKTCSKMLLRKNPARAAGIVAMIT